MTDRKVNIAQTAVISLALITTSISLPVMASTQAQKTTENHASVMKSGSNIAQAKTKSLKKGKKLKVSKKRHHTQMKHKKN